LPHCFIPDDELQALADDIRAHGQREPVLTFEGKILDGWNRVRACRLIGRKPWTMELDPASAKMSPESLVISANLRRRHLSVGQMSAIVVELSEQMEREGRRTTRDALAANLPPTTGRPKTSLTLAAEMVGMDERRERDARAVKAASVEIFTQLKRGVIALHEAMVAIRPAAEAEAPALVRHSEVSSTEADEAVPEIPAGDQPEDDEPAGVPIFAPSPMAVPPQPLTPAPTKPGPATKAAEPVRPPPSAAVLRKAANRILAICGESFHAEVCGRLTPEESVQFAKLPDAEMLKVKTLLLRGWVFPEALRDVIDELTPDDNIRALLTRAVQGGGTYRCTIAGFTVAVANEQARSGLEARLEDWP
jgi:ParB-like chromosome segregation protein Spo0J